MNLIHKGFSLKYEVLKIAAIKPGGSGIFNGTPYKASTKFRSTNTIEKENKDVGIQEIETILEYRVRCNSNQEATQVSELIRNSRANNIPIYVNADIPRKQEQGDIYNVESFDDGQAFLALNGSVKGK